MNAFYLIVAFFLQNLCFLTTLEYNGEDPSLSSPSWTVRYFIHQQVDYAASAVLEVDTPVRYVAIFIAVDEGLQLGRINILSSSKTLPVSVILASTQFMDLKLL